MGGGRSGGEGWGGGPSRPAVRTSPLPAGPTQSLSRLIRGMGLFWEFPPGNPLGSREGRAEASECVQEGKGEAAVCVGGRCATWGRPNPRPRETPQAASQRTVGQRWGPRAPTGARAQLLQGDPRTPGSTPSPGAPWAPEHRLPEPPQSSPS